MRKSRVRVVWGGVLAAALLTGGFFAAVADAEPAPAGMIRVPAGPFVMGRNGGPANEAPAHEVRLPAFFIDRNLVTLGEFARFLDAHGPRGPKGERYFDDDDEDARIHLRGRRWTPDPGLERYPAAEVSLLGAAAYCRSLGKRLPSEAEWEKAARGTDGRLYPWGSDRPGADRVHFRRFHGDTAPVGRFPMGASPFGVLDMGASLSEWTISAARPYPYRPGAGREDPAAETDRVLRGGITLTPPGSRTATHREIMSFRRQRAGHAYVGFRCAKDI